GSRHLGLLSVDRGVGRWNGGSAAVDCHRRSRRTPCRPRGRRTAFRVRSIVLVLPAEFLFEVLDGGELALEPLRERGCESELGDAHRFCGVAKRILDYDPVLRLAENHPDRRLITVAADQVVDRGEIEVQLACVLGPEGCRLELDHHEAAKVEVVEEEIDPEFFAADFERILTSHEGEADTQLEEEVAEVLEQSLMECALLRVLAGGEELEVVWILEDLLGEVRLGRRERTIEVRDRVSLAASKVSLDLKHEDIAAPAVLESRAQIPLPR